MSDIPAAADALRGILQHRQAAGEREVYLTKDAREVLARGVALGEGTSPEPQAADDGAVLLEDIGKVQPASCSGATPAEKIADLRRQAEGCKAARALGSLKETMVFSVGDPEAELMLVGEAPGAQEERQQEPFVGPAGQKLEQIFKAMGISRGDVYISNICKFRPDMGQGQGYGNRKPTPEEMRSCMPFVLAEIEVVQPKVIVALGGTAAEGLLQIERASVSKMRGRFHDDLGVPVMVTFHPSYLLRSEQDADGGMAKKRQVWEDMLQVMEVLGLPVSEKQRGFFRV